MKRIHRAAVASLAVSGMIGTAMSLGTGAAGADTATEMFLSALSGSGVTGVDTATAVRVGQSVCPMLAEPGQNVANVAADVADMIGRPLGPATMFTGLAIQVFCPGAVAALAYGKSPLPLPGL